MNLLPAQLLTARIGTLAAPLGWSPPCRGCLSFERSALPYGSRTATCPELKAEQALSSTDL